MQRTLHVMRHAKSDWGAGQPDHERPLNDRGWRDADAAGEHLTSLPESIELVLCSTSTRTRQTLDRAVEGGLEVSDVQFSEQIYESSLSHILPLLREVEPTCASVLLLGHFPTVHDLVLTLATEDEHPGWEEMELKFPTSAIATITFEHEWEALGEPTGTLRDFVIPRG
ncbi:MAG: SixA phosphatase family protein [Gulosibacter sp.]|uniref:SixA phosphatase family protein n=1 Tax=Gulosibacter sp. TaxID=2817531 RepID=UPI003F90CA3A